MTNMPSNFTPQPGEQLDLLISRIADGEASTQDWASFNALAEKSPDAWKHLAQAQRDHQALSLAVGVALHAAERVDLPSRDAADAFLHRVRPQPVGSRLRQYGGWAVAACVALAWLGANGGQFSLPRPNTAPGSNVAGINIPIGYEKVASPEDALALYRKKAQQDGRFIAEVPVLLESSPAPTGSGYRVVYVRQIVEQATVDNLLRFAQDENGKPFPVKMTPPRRAGVPE